MKRLLGLLASLSLMSCTPELNWRIHREADTNWQVAFPAKPVSVKRTLALTDPPNAAIELQLWAANVNEVRYTIGYARWVGKPSDHAKQEQLAKTLESAMLNNISAHQKTFAQASDLASSNDARPSDSDVTVTARPLLKAVGTILLNPKQGPVEAQLWMQTHVRSGDVIEAIVLGPTESFSQEAAEQFLSSFRPRL